MVSVWSTSMKRDIYRALGDYAKDPRAWFIEHLYGDALALKYVETYREILAATSESRVRAGARA